MCLWRDADRAQVEQQYSVKVDLRRLKLDRIRRPYPKLGYETIHSDNTRPALLFRKYQIILAAPPPPNAASANGGTAAKEWWGSLGEAQLLRK